MHLGAAEQKLYERLIEIEAVIVKLAEDFRILGAIQWPRSATDKFLQGWRTGNPRIPEVNPAPPPGLDSMIEGLTWCMQRTPRDHPLGEIIWKTAWSYSTAAYMLKSMGTPGFTDRSVELYGLPDSRWGNQKFTDLSAAEFMLRTSADLIDSCVMPGVDSVFSAEELASRLRARIDPVFIEDPIEVELSTELSAKA